MTFLVKPWHILLTSIVENEENMDKEITENIEESKLYKMLIFMLFMEDLKEKNAQWESFAEVSDNLSYLKRVVYTTNIPCLRQFSF